MCCYKASPACFSHERFPVSHECIDCASRAEYSLLKYKSLTAFNNDIMIPTEDIQRRIVELEVEHRDLDAVIELLARDVLRDELQLRRLKKRKLQLKDHITLLKMQLVPDIPA